MIEGPRLAALVASKLCHEFVGPMTGMMQGLEMLKESDDGRNADALMLLEQGLTRITAKADFLRNALADSLGQEGVGFLDEIKPVAERLYATLKPELVWPAANAVVSRPALKVFLNLLLFAAECLPKGGKVSVTIGADELSVVAEGARAMLKPDVAAALRGEGGADGFQASFALPLLTGVIARQAGLELAAREAPERIELILRGTKPSG